MEYLDYYDENGNHLGVETRENVHSKALWHNTVHCWLYTNKGDIFFQIRQEEKTFYTTASGHVDAGETIKEGFKREIKEEIGIDVDLNKTHLVGIIPFIMDKEKKDGSIFRDRAFSNVYVCECDDDVLFNYDENEIMGLVKVNAQQTFDLFHKGRGQIPATIYQRENGVIVKKERDIDFNEFLVNKHETALEKYGNILKKVIELT